VAISIAVTPIGEDAAAPQTAEQQQEEERTTRINPISDKAGSHGLRNANTRHDRANGYLAAAVLLDANKRRGGRIGFGGHCDRQYASAGRRGGGD
jgi:hypothetical protein